MTLGLGHQKRPINRRQSCWRLLWAAVLLLHAPITVSVFSDLWTQTGSIRWSSILLLTVANAFFVLEVVSAYSLRILSDRRKVVTFLVVIAILHVGMIERGMPEYVRDADVQYWLLLTTAGLASCAGIIRLLRAVSTRIAAALPTGEGVHSPRGHYARRSDLTLVIQDSLLGRLCTPPRAPPHTSL